MKVRMLNKMVAVESINRIRRKKDNPLLVMPDSNDSTGIIRHLYDGYIGDLAVGKVVCFGDKRQNVKIDGTDLDIMGVDNIFVILDEENTGVETKKESDQSSKE